MKNKFVVLFAVLSLMISSLACAALSTELGLTNLRMALDQDGNNPTTIFAPSDLFYAVADLANALLSTRQTPNLTLNSRHRRWISPRRAIQEPSISSCPTIRVGPPVNTRLIYT